MIIASRQMPRIAIRRPPPESFSTSSAASPGPTQLHFNRRLDTPPLTPRYPSPSRGSYRSLLPRRYRRVVHALGWLFVIGLCGLIARISFRLNDDPRSGGGPVVEEHTEQGQVGDESLPDFPSPIAVKDQLGRSRWTISIPPHLRFPLSSADYKFICTKSSKVAADVAGLNHLKSERFLALQSSYSRHDPYYMDIDLAEEGNILSWKKRSQVLEMQQRLAKTAEHSESVNAHNGDIQGSGESNEAHVCDKTLTFVMESGDAGLGKALMALWVAYGLAKKEGRAFFIDDTDWTYGKYATYFTPPAPPSCLPPPRNHVTPCPPQARHLLVSAATLPWALGEVSAEESKGSGTRGGAQQKKIFALASQGYKALFTLSHDNEDYVQNRKAQLKAQNKTTASDSMVGTTVGVHVRRGDRHPFEYQYSESYIPLDRYSSAASLLLRTAFNSTRARSLDFKTFERNSTILLASDDPEIYLAPELAHTTRAQERIALASKADLDAAAARAARTASSTSTRSHRPKRPVDSTIGWEGGFFAPLFWSLGAPHSSSKFPMSKLFTPKYSPPAVAAALADSRPSTPSPQALHLRELVGHAYLLDLKVLGEASDAIVCAASAVGCRLLAVMMGWENAMGNKKWLNIDGGAKGWWAIE
ncbi:MAG: hypothetical protein M1833_003271 [Piccolia ochrophora]|nr:MAG: hypothetical protein M1833_003271 [Piccolia ochrophora]